MAYPTVLDELLRARLPLRPDVFRRWQMAIRDEVIPAIERAEDLAAQKPVKTKAVA